MSKYYLNKFLFTADRDPDLLKRYMESPHQFVSVWEQSIGPNLIGNTVEASTVHAFTEDERRVLVDHDFVSLFEMGAHYFLNLTLFVGIYDEPYAQTDGPLAFQREFARKLQHWRGKDYPCVAT